jgi:hypothetical protein
MAHSSLDPRIIMVSFEVNGKLKTYSSPFFITANGTRYANALQNEADIVLANLNKPTQDFLLTETTPYNINNTSKTISVYAGRQSYGTSLVYSGNIVMANVTQPPDVGITLKCLTGNFLKTNVIGVNQSGQASLFQITNAMAQNYNAILNFQATNKNVSNYSFSGSSTNQIQLLNSYGGINVYLDNGVLVVKNSGQALGGIIKLVSPQTGMIGIPQFTEQGLQVKFLFDPHVTLGGLMRIKSYEYPAANGDYIIYKLGFQLSTRETPFYYIAEGQRILNQKQGTIQ